MLIAPSLLASDFANLEKEIASVSSADMLHVDVMDGAFTDDITIGQPVLKAIRKITDMPLDVHLMVITPDKAVPSFLSAGADAVTFHLEAAKDPSGIISTIKAAGKGAGLAISPKTEAESIFPFLDRIDKVLVMTVEPGKGGQKLIPECLDKARLISEEAKKRGLSLTVQIDGGVNEETAPLAKAAGVSALVAGTFIFKEENREAAIAHLRSISE